MFLLDATITRMKPTQIDGALAKQRQNLRTQIVAAKRVVEGTIGTGNKTLNEIYIEGAKSKDPANPASQKARELIGGQGTEQINITQSGKQGLVVQNTLEQEVMVYAGYKTGGWFGKKKPGVISESAKGDKFNADRLNKVVQPDATALHQGTKVISAIYSAPDQKSFDRLVTEEIKAGLEALDGATGHGKHPKDAVDLLAEAAELKALATITKKDGDPKIRALLDKLDKYATGAGLKEEYAKDADALIGKEAKPVGTDGASVTPPGKMTAEQAAKATPSAN